MARRARHSFGRNSWTSRLPCGSIASVWTDELFHLDYSLILIRCIELPCDCVRPVANWGIHNFYWRSQMPSIVCTHNHTAPANMFWASAGQRSKKISLHERLFASWTVNDWMTVAVLLIIHIYWPFLCADWDAESLEEKRVWAMNHRCKLKQFHRFKMSWFRALLDCFHLMALS